MIDKMEKEPLHIFFVLSNITQLVAETWIMQNNLQEKALILHPKRFKPDTDLATISYFPYFDDLITYNIPGKNVIKKRRQCQEINNYIDKHSLGQEFVFYVPHLYINTLRVIVNHSLCKNYFYIEEGTLSYMELSNILVSMPNVKMGHLQSIGFGFKERSAFPDLNKIGICIHPKAFPFLHNKLIIENHVLEKLLKAKQKSENYNFSNEALLVFDSSVENRMAELHEYMLSILNSIAYFKYKGFKKVYFKFHPDQFLYQLIHFIRKYLYSGAFEIEFIELPSNKSMELILINSKNILVIHTMSSLGYYASIFGHNVFSNAECLLSNNSFKEVYFDPINKDFNFQFIPVIA